MTWTGRISREVEFESKWLEIRETDDGTTTTEETTEEAPDEATMIEEETTIVDAAMTGDEEVILPVRELIIESSLEIYRHELRGRT